MEWPYIEALPWLRPLMSKVPSQSTCCRAIAQSLPSCEL